MEQQKHKPKLQIENVQDLYATDIDKQGLKPGPKQ